MNIGIEGMAVWGQDLLIPRRTIRVVGTGATTLSCVRAMVVDAVQSGFNVLVSADCCAGRAQAPQDANLYNTQQKYAYVGDADEILV
ncbi:isochorismatase family protein [Paracoccus aestuariivivens]|uniref:Isochorismatase family protein n=1 Tax=Paracoccus aestuariivivens TaxID=1820333 RepID=A0A6L6JE05_9RHOB|nr:isochorismatase family protein [Paracoccus aestuariivivens]MTH80230.1 isochorismatase family protein [Paracoccus aestuariivivens]